MDLDRWPFGQAVEGVQQGLDTSFYRISYTSGYVTTRAGYSPMQQLTPFLPKRCSDADCRPELSGSALHDVWGKSELIFASKSAYTADDSPIMNYHCGICPDNSLVILSCIFSLTVPALPLTRIQKNGRQMLPSVKVPPSFVSATSTLSKMAAISPTIVLSS